VKEGKRRGRKERGDEGGGREGERRLKLVEKEGKGEVGGGGGKGNTARCTRSQTACNGRHTDS